MAKFSGPGDEARRNSGVTPPAVEGEGDEQYRKKQEGAVRSIGHHGDFYLIERQMVAVAVADDGTPFVIPFFRPPAFGMINSFIGDGGRAHEDPVEACRVAI